MSVGVLSQTLKFIIINVPLEALILKLIVLKTYHRLKLKKESKPVAFIVFAFT